MEGSIEDRRKKQHVSCHWCERTGIPAAVPAPAGPDKRLAAIAIDAFHAHERRWYRYIRATNASMLRNAKRGALHSARAACHSPPTIHSTQPRRHRTRAAGLRPIVRKPSP
ncbi:hypothetical protein [Burkholderia sp. BCC1985]|uniref:hypothetical protein n=1 Tax=Burkholderia sp. BCC1985 TaxID=2817442 RepID=UPI002AB13DB1|nr:hypothetical protein [Burkholderia sp. BCC1985]